LADGLVGGGSDVDIGDHGLVDPVGDGIAEGRDHDGDADHHGDGGHEGGDGGAVAMEGARKIFGGDAGEDAVFEEFLKGDDEGAADLAKEGDGEGEGGDDEEAGEEGEGGGTGSEGLP
jgi:hypothetical protein